MCSVVDEGCTDDTFDDTASEDDEDDSTCEDENILLDGFASEEVISIEDDSVLDDDTSGDEEVGVIGTTSVVGQYVVYVVTCVSSVTVTMVIPVGTVEV